MTRSSRPARRGPLPAVALALMACLPALTAAQLPLTVGERPDGGILVPTFQELRPAGDLLRFRGRPTDLALSPDRKIVVVKGDRGLVVVSAGDWRILQELPFPAGGGSPHGLAFRSDGRRVYASTAQNLIHEASVGPDNRLAWLRAIVLPGPRGAGAAQPCGIAVAPGDAVACVCLSRNNTLGIVDLASGRLEKEIPVGIAPYSVVLSPGGGRAYVSNWGGAPPGPGERSAPSSGTSVSVDERGIADRGSVSVVELAASREIGQAAAGRQPAGLALAPDGRRLFVANANADEVWVYDTPGGSASPGLRLAGRISTQPAGRLPLGSAPNALALSPDGRRLFVANGGNNAVAVLEVGGRNPAAGARPLGFIPSGWYPGAVGVDDRHLFVASVKGTGSRWRADGEPGAKGWRVQSFAGTLQRIRLPGPRELRRYTEAAGSGARVAEAAAQAGAPAKDLPPIRHCVYVIKENRTYDQVLGDMSPGNGDPNLCLFGRGVTPNHHALAEEFVLLDNYYCNGANSADGHAWATEGNASAYLEKSFGGFTRSYTFGDDPLAYSASGFLWDPALAAGLSFRNYGEMDYAETVPGSAAFVTVLRDFTGGAGRIRFVQKIGIETLRRHTAPDYPGWNMRIPDVVRADRFLRELAGFEQQGELPRLTLIYLPQDHTSGATPVMPTPRAHLADNDLALGRIVEGISRSRFWPRTCIFVNEDDPQDGFDHVDGHRSLCLVIGPYSRRKAVVSRFYNQTSVLHTIERLLGLPPMNQMVATAPVMTECFTSRPDVRPFAAQPNSIPLDELNPPLRSLRGPALHWARESLRQPLDRLDEADEETFNRILWHTVKGGHAPYPASDRAGARAECRP